MRKIYKWTNSNEILVARLCKEGLTAQKIADTMGDGATKNIVLCKLRKLKQETDSKSVKSTKSRNGCHENLLKSLNDSKPKQCRYIAGDPSNENTVLCKKTATHSSYCKKHYNLCCVPTKGVKRE